MSTAFLFPGQGSQYVGMGVALYRASAEARLFCDKADAQLGYALTRLCFEGPEAELNLTAFTQPALFVVATAMWQTLKASLPQPAFVAGHSLGEFVALVASGALDFADGLRLVAERGRLMARAGEGAPGGMAVLLGATLEAAEALCAAAATASGQPVVVANDNCPGQVVISGALAALEAATALAPSHNVRRIQRLPISVAPHSVLMSDAQTAFTHLLAAAPLRAPQVPVVLNATAAPATDPDEIRQALLRQLISPVRWRESMLWMAAQGVDHFVEIGPKDVLTGMARRTLPDARAEAVEKMAFFA
ncbi:MAG TPA: ACP S-malonyltransferase [Anaerolineae bacterium]|nr:ACP S-malonyltransferase [Anaerolineae bacterium]HQI84464.1 ACP S-malonyltransferase [Anaerolineae bacterium]